MKNLLADDIAYPALVLLEPALQHNISAMAAWCLSHDFAHSPHGKTTLCPRIFRRQLEAGAWGITTASPSQIRPAVAAGARRVLVANQIVDPPGVRMLAEALKRVEVLSLVDSVDGVRRTAELLRAERAVRPLRVLLELGRAGWRAGVRSVEEGRQVLAAVADAPDVLVAAGFEGFEGLAEDDSAADAYLSQALATADALRETVPVARPILSLGGSGWLDLVARVLGAAKERYEPVLRSGCYVTHDHGAYADLAERARRRGGDLPRFMPALELWAVVLSLRDGSTAILGAGRRDAPHDAGLPVPLFAFREGEKRSLGGARVTRLNDQHAWMSLPEGTDLRVGDRVALGISHPCTAFDKRRVIPVVDERYDVVDTYRTVGP